MGFYTDKTPGNQRGRNNPKLQTFEYWVGNVLCTVKMKAMGYVCAGVIKEDHRTAW